MVQEYRRMQPNRRQERWPPFQDRHSEVRDVREVHRLLDSARTFINKLVSSGPWPTAGEASVGHVLPCFGITACDVVEIVLDPVPYYEQK